MPNGLERRVLLLGLGAQGKAALHDLVTSDESTHVVAADSDPGLEAYVTRYPAARVRGECLDAGDDARVIEETELEIANVHHAARQHERVILTEFGLDPGLDLILGAETLGEFDEVHEFHAYGAGISGPNARGNPLNYKFSWSAIGVMRSYRRPARVITRGRVTVLDATSLFEPGRYHDRRDMVTGFTAMQ